MTKDTAGLVLELPVKGGVTAGYHCVDFFYWDRLGRSLTCTVSSYKDTDQAAAGQALAQSEYSWRDVEWDWAGNIQLQILAKLKEDSKWTKADPTDVQTATSPSDTPAPDEAKPAALNKSLAIGLEDASGAGKDTFTLLPFSKTITAGTVKTGSALRLQLQGSYTSTAKPGTLTVTMAFGGVAIGIFALSLPVSQTNEYYKLDATLVLREAGVLVQGLFTAAVNAGNLTTVDEPIQVKTPVVVDFTQDQEFTLQGKFSEDGNSITTPVGVLSLLS